VLAAEQRDDETIVVLAAEQPTAQDVRRPERPGRVAGPRTVVELEGATDLLHLPVAQDHDPIRERQRLGLIVSHVDHRRPDLQTQALDLEAHLVAQLRVEVGQRLVHQHQVRPQRERAGERDTLLLTARQLARVAIAVRLHANRGQRSRDGRVDASVTTLAGAATPARAQPEREVVPHPHVRPERVALEDDTEIALRRRHLRSVTRHLAAAQPDRAAVRHLEPGDHPQCRRLAAAARSDDHDRFALADLEVQATEGRHLPVSAGQSLNRQKGHGHAAFEVGAGSPGAGAPIS
jgi:hypothetical protein